MNICIYCGSSPGRDKEIREQASNLGRLIAERGHHLVYGGSSLGVMGIVADAVMENNGEVIGIIPKGLFNKEVAHQGITTLITVENMHQRKYMMAERADAFLALPGGFGTLEELFETITWNQLGIHDKPVTLFNLNGFFNPLIKMIDHSQNMGFIKPENRKIFKIAETLEQCLRFSEEKKS